MTDSTKIDYVSIVQDLRDEADLCRNETATDIADLLDDAASCIVAMKSQFVALRADLAAAQEALKAAEALAESYRQDAERLDWLLKLWPIHEPCLAGQTQWPLEIVRLVHSFHTHGPTSSEPRAAIDAAKEAK